MHNSTWLEGICTVAVRTYHQLNNGFDSREVDKGIIINQQNGWSKEQLVFGVQPFIHNILNYLVPCTLSSFQFIRIDPVTCLQMQTSAKGKIVFIVVPLLL